MLKKNSKLYKLIEEQRSFLFTGKINILFSTRRQLIGQIFIKNGELINAMFIDSVAVKAMVRIFIWEFEGKDLNFVIEPEIIDRVTANIHYPFKVLTERIEKIYASYRKTRELRPPDDVKLIVVPSALSREVDFSFIEFDVLATMLDFSKVVDIYKYSPRYEHETTMGLVSLRKKGIVRVLKEDSSTSR